LIHKKSEVLPFGDRGTDSLAGKFSHFAKAEVELFGDRLTHLALGIVHFKNVYLLTHPSAADAFADGPLVWPTSSCYRHRQRLDFIVR
jgi:hypothetical protein